MIGAGWSQLGSPAEALHNVVLASYCLVRLQDVSLTLKSGYSITCPGHVTLT